MTEQERAVYDQMSPREQRSIDALSEGSRSPAILMWARMNADRLERERRRQERKAPEDNDGRYGP